MRKESTVFFWNCNGAFRNKYAKVLETKADVIIIVECENLDKIKFTLPGYQHIWIGEGKGLAVFAKSEFSLYKLNWNDGPLRYFLPVAVDGLPIVGVWAKNHISKNFTFGCG